MLDQRVLCAFYLLALSPILGFWLRVILSPAFSGDNCSFSKLLILASFICYNILHAYHTDNALFALVKIFAGKLNRHHFCLPFTLHDLNEYLVILFLVV